MKGVVDLLNSVLRVWEWDKTLQCAISTICIVLSLLFLGGWFLGLVDGSMAFSFYGVALLVATIAFPILTGFRIYNDRASKRARFVPNEHDSFWGQSRQNDGRITTNFNFHFRATNFTRRPLRLLTARLVRPRWQSRTEWSVHVVNPLDDQYGQYPIFPSGGSASAHCTIWVDKAVGTTGRPMAAAVLRISDNHGWRHRVKFRHLREVPGRP